MYAKNVYSKYKDNIEKVMEFGEGYKEFISNCKTERLCVKESIKQAKENGFKNFYELDSIKPGDKFYIQSMGKTIALFVMGEKSLVEGMHILGAHIDSPRMDLKQNPIYQKEGFALADTHYYGGIKKYQWVTIPLSLIGVIVKKDGSVIDVNIGDNESDPVFGVSDLLIHLSSQLMKKSASEVIAGENLDLILGSFPLNDDEKDGVKANILKILQNKYDIEEEDFLSAEIEVVPNGKARDYGLDRSMVMGYGHDDRSCAYTSLQAILDIEKCEYTCCCILVDKEEIGSVGATGAHSLFFENAVAEILEKQGITSFISVRKAMRNSKMISGDVSAGVDPLYSDVNDCKNAAYFGKGVVLNKYLGSRGKGGSNDANPEYIAKLRKIFDDHGVYFQTAEIGKVDQGGGGTIAYILGNYNMNIIDSGIPVLNMHSPCEIVSKLDVYEAYQAYKIFLLNI